MISFNLRNILCLGFLVLIYSCRSDHVASGKLVSQIEKLEQAQVIQYSHIKSIENRFNFSSINDTLDVSIFNNQENEPAFHIASSRYDWLYDSKELTELDHEKRVKSVELFEDVNDFEIWDKNILQLVDSLSQCTYKLISINNDQFHHCSQYYQYRSKVDSNETVFNELMYTLPEEGIDALFHTEVIIREGDTLQVQHHTLSDIKLNTTIGYDSIKARIGNLGYELYIPSSDSPFGEEAIKEGERLELMEFEDVNNNKISIVHGDRDYALIVFSFIGCTPCEKALRQLQNHESGLRSKVDLYYSSFQNDNKAIKNYLKDKHMFRNAFAKESHMIQEFRLPVSPSFVLIDSTGKIVKIFEGYDGSEFKELNLLLD